MIRTTAYLFRQLHNFQHKKQQWIQGFLTTKELKQAKILWIAFFQYHFLSEELEYLRGAQKGSRQALVSQLDLYLDQDSPIRCRGRLQDANLPIDA